MALHLPNRKNKKQNAESKIDFRHPVQSTQQILPVKDLYNGIIITKDNRYVKIMEIKPIPFALMTGEEKGRVIEQFRHLLRLTPTNLQITEITLPADLTEQLNALTKAMRREKSPECREIDEQYRQRLLDSQMTSVSRRFFISFEYEKTVAGFRKPNIAMIANELNSTANTIKGLLATCGNEVVEFNQENANYYPAEILYTVLNRKVDTLNFDEKLTQTFGKYYQHYGNRDFYIPPAEYIAPDTISLRDRRFVVIDGMYYTYYYIPSRHYRDMVYAGWLNPFINSMLGVDVNLYFSKVPADKVMTSLRRNIVYSTADMDMADNASQTMDSSMSTYNAATYLKDAAMADGMIMDMSVMITIYGETPEIVDYRASKILEQASKMEIKLFPCTYEQNNAFMSSLPLGRLADSIKQISKRNCALEGAASTYPFTAFEIRDPKGIYFGDDMATGSMTIVDLFDKKKFVNSNIFISGTSGSGKTYSLSLLAIRSRINHIPVILIAPEKQHEFKRLCEAIGGQFIEIAPGSPHRINIMQIFKPDEEARMLAAAIDGSEDETSLLAEKVSNLKDFFALYLPDISIQEKQLLDKCIMETYRKFGIGLNNESLVDPNYSDGRYKPMPILSDLQKTVEEQAKYNPALQRLADIIPYFTEGSGSSFNGATNVNLDNEFTVIGLERMKNDTLKLGMYIAMDFAWSKIKESRNKHSILICDEWWKLANDPSSAEYSMNIAKTIRAYGSSMILATQQLKDIFATANGKYGEGVLANCYTKILLGMTPDDADRVQDILNLSDLEHDELITYKNGQCLLMIGTIKLKLQFVSSKLEHELISTNHDDLLKLAREKQSKRKRSDYQITKRFSVFDNTDIIYAMDTDEYIATYETNL